MAAAEPAAAGIDEPSIAGELWSNASWWRIGGNLTLKTDCQITRELLETLIEQLRVFCAGGENLSLQDGTFLLHRSVERPEGQLAATLRLNNSLHAVWRELLEAQLSASFPSTQDDQTALFRFRLVFKEFRLFWDPAKPYISLQVRFCAERVGGQNPAFVVGREAICELHLACERSPTALAIHGAADPSKARDKLVDVFDSVMCRVVSFAQAFLARNGGHERFIPHHENHPRPAPREVPGVSIGGAKPAVKSINLSEEHEEWVDMQDDLVDKKEQERFGKGGFRRRNGSEDL